MPLYRDVLPLLVAATHVTTTDVAWKVIRDGLVPGSMLSGQCGGGRVDIHFTLFPPADKRGDRRLTNRIENRGQSVAVIAKVLRADAMEQCSRHTTVRGAHRSLINF